MSVPALPQRGASFGWPTLAQVWVFLSIATPVVMVLAADIMTVDIAYVVRAGNEMLSSGQLLAKDTFTFTAVGTDWINQQWGAQVILALLHRVGGWEAIGAARALLVGASFLLVYRVCRLGRISKRAAAGLTFASAVVALPQLGARPQLFAILLFSAALYCVVAREERPTVLWGLVPITVLWVNLHGTFFLVPCLVALAAMEDLTHRKPIKSLLIVGGIVLVASLANPFGLGVWEYVLSLSADPDVTGAVTEWAPSMINELPGALFFASVIATTVLLARRTGRVDLGVLSWLVFFLVIGLMAQRATIWWGLAMPSVLARVLPDTDGVEEGRPVHALIIGLIALAVLLLAPWWRTSVTGKPLLGVAPVELTDALVRTTEPGDRVFNAQVWGSWLELEVPQNPVFIDSRIELFSRAVWDDYRDVSQGREGWQEILDRWDVDAAIINTEQQEHLLPRMMQDSGWQLVARSDEGAVLTRVSP